MKKYLLPYLMLVLTVGALNPLHASSQDISNDSTKQKIVIKPGIRPEVVRTIAQIVSGESEAQKQAKAQIAKTSSRQLVSRERVTEVAAPAIAYNIGDLRSLYQSAAAKFGIDWKLIEAVHQVETGKSTDTCIKSYAGATGPMQFLPSTFRHYATDGSDICSVKDSVYAAANLLAAGGADSGDITSALFNYNHSMSYVNLVKSVMDSI